jgi:hypothetical protein
MEIISKFKLENGSEFTVEKSWDYIHQLEQTVRGVLNTQLYVWWERVDGEHYCQKCLDENPFYCV